MVQEVAILFENYLWRGKPLNKAQFRHNFNAFKSSNYPRLAKIGLGISYRKEVLWRTCGEALRNIRYGLDRNVMYMDLFPASRRRQYVISRLGSEGYCDENFRRGQSILPPDGL